MEQWQTIIILGVITTAIVMVPIILNIFNRPDETPEISSYLDMPLEEAYVPTPPPMIETPSFQGQPSGLSDIGGTNPFKRHAPEQMLGAPVQLKVAPQPMHGGKTDRIRTSLDPDNDQTAAAKREQWLSRIRNLDQDVVIFDDAPPVDINVFKPKKTAVADETPFKSDKHLFSVGKDRADGSLARKSEDARPVHRQVHAVSVEASEKQTTDSTASAMLKENKDSYFQLPSAFGRQHHAEVAVDGDDHKPSMSGRLLSGLFSTILEAGEKSAAGKAKKLR